MVITATFDSIEEMRDFAGLITTSGGSLQPAGASLQPAAPAAPTVPTTQPPVQQTAPVQPAPSTPVQQAPAAVPTTTPAYTQEDLAGAAMVLMDAGRQPELQALLQSFGVDSLPALSPEQYGAFATALRSMGAPI